VAASTGGALVFLGAPTSSYLIVTDSQFRGNQVSPVVWAYKGATTDPLFWQGQSV
jgi:hypothetical protein